MSAAEIAAYVGAGAWIPHIAAWLYRALVRPIVTVVPEATAEVGFTSFGPIFNLRLALGAERSDALVHGMELAVQHESGARHTFRWSGINETFSEIRDEAGITRQVVGRDQVPIALKVGTNSLVEKFVRFQDPTYHDSVRPLTLNLVAHFNHLKRTDPEYVSKTLNSRELFELVEARRQYFWWQPGSHQVRLNLSSPKKLRVRGDTMRFTLSAADVERLRQNIDLLAAGLENATRSNLPNFQAEPINWNWAIVDIPRPG